VARLETTLQHDLRRLANRLYEQLVRYYPQVLHLCPAADEAWIWALLEQAPTPTAAARLSRSRVQRLLAQHRIRRVSPDEVLATLRRPPLPVMPGTVEAAQAHVRILLPQLQLLAQQATECAQHVAHLLEGLQGEPVEHRDVAILRSLPGVGRVVAATMLAEASRLLAHRDYHGLRVQAGVAPVTRQSGKRRLVVMRHACNPRLRNALHYWSQVSVQHDQPSREHYHRLRARGHSHARALRGVADRLLRVLVSMLATGTPYDESRRRRVAAAMANAA
jgi:transposase